MEIDTETCLTLYYLDKADLVGGNVTGSRFTQDGLRLRFLCLDLDNVWL
jgi:hypothetical protein